MKHYTLNLQGEFNDSLAREAIEFLESLKEEIRSDSEIGGTSCEVQKHGKLTILFNSSGGLGSIGFALYDYLRDFEESLIDSWTINAVACGIVGSACLYAYLGCSKRSALPHTQFLLHPSSIPPSGDGYFDLNRLENMKNRLEKVKDLGTKILLDRTSMDENCVNAAIGDKATGEKILFVSEAIRLGIVNETR